MIRRIDRVMQLNKRTVLLLCICALLLGSCGKNEVTMEQLVYNIKSEVTYRNPLKIRPIGDPFVMKASDGLYYCYPTSNAANGYKVWVSEDLINWEVEGLNAYTKTREGWAGGDFWAPEVYEFDGKFYMYYTARWKEKDSLRLGVAVSDSPVGPFLDVSDQPMFDFGYAVIDAHVFVDDTGEAYFYYSRDCSENFVGGFNESHIYGIRLSQDKLSVEGEPVLLTQPEQTWEIQSGSYRWNEGAFVLKNQDVYYLMYSANFYADKKYSIGYATSSSPLGPFVKYEHNPILFAQSDWSEISGPGHHSITTSPLGNQLLVVYHTHINPVLGGGDRQVAIDTMGFREDGTLYMNGPTLSPQLKPALWDERIPVSLYDVYYNQIETTVLSDGEWSLYTAADFETSVIALQEQDFIEVRFQQPTTVKGLSLYRDALNKEVTSRYRLVTSHGYEAQGIGMSTELGEGLHIEFEPMVLDWVRIYPDSSSEVLPVLSEIVLF